MTSPASFTKLSSGILDSTLWCESDRTRLMWICMLAMADQYGRVMGSVPGLANRARVPLDDARAAIRTFLSPDPDSRTKDFEGRRIEEIDGGWLLLNHSKYRELRADEDRREQNRLAQARKRERDKASAKVSTRHQESAQSAHTDTDTDTDTEAKAKSRKKGVRASAPKLPAENFLSDVDSQTLDDWVTVRKAKKAGPITSTVASILRKAATTAGLTPQLAVEYCIARAWQNFNADWYAKASGPSPSHAPASTSLIRGRPSIAATWSDPT